MLSRASIDRLGKRIQTGVPTEADLLELDHFRSLFQTSYEYVIRVVEDKLHLAPTGRPAKTTQSIIDKLRRETTIRLSQMQDVAGCRLIVTDSIEQERIVALLTREFPEARIADRRTAPSNGYRAVHIIASHLGWPVEIQVRTEIQHSWAELSEKLADRFGQSIKYGQGDRDVLSWLRSGSEVGGLIEEAELEMNTATDYYVEGDSTAADTIEDLTARLSTLRRHYWSVIEAARGYLQ